MKALLLAALLLMSGAAFAHVTETEAAAAGLAKLDAISYAAAILAATTIVSIALHSRMTKGQKKAFFVLIAAVIIATTAYLEGSVIATNLASVTGGPVHWHAHVAFKVCGIDYSLAHRDIAVDKPLHTHGDELVHIETTPLSYEDVQLGEFFENIGGEFTKTSLAFPTDTALVSARNGDMCNGVPGTLKMYVNSNLEPRMDEYVISPVEAGDIDMIEIVFGP
jgi:hypothetical protein